MAFYTPNPYNNVFYISDWGPFWTDQTLEAGIPSADPVTDIPDTVDKRKAVVSSSYLSPPSTAVTPVVSGDMVRNDVSNDISISVKNDSIKDVYLNAAPKTKGIVKDPF